MDLQLLASWGQWDGAARSRGETVPVTLSNLSGAPSMKNENMFVGIVGHINITDDQGRFIFLYEGGVQHACSYPPARLSCFISTSAHRETQHLCN